MMLPEIAVMVEYERLPTCPVPGQPKCGCRYYEVIGGTDHCRWGAGLCRNRRAILESTLEQCRLARADIDRIEADARRECER